MAEREEAPTQRRAIALGLAAKVHVEVAGVDAATAQKCADLAHEFCPYSRATRGNIDVEVVATAK